MRSVGGFVMLCMLAGACSSPDERPRAGAGTTAPPAVAASGFSGTAPAGALVTLEPVGEAVPLPGGGAVLDQFSKAFVPETLFVRVGQPVTFKNSEDQQHNVTVLRGRTGTPVINISQGQGDVFTHTFEQPGEYEVLCDVHPGMRATLVATTTPYAVFADNGGKFSLPGVPPGAYRLRISADGRDTERLVDVTATSR